MGGGGKGRRTEIGITSVQNTIREKPASLLLAYQFTTVQGSIPCPPTDTNIRNAMKYRYTEKTAEEKRLRFGDGISKISELDCKYEHYKKEWWICSRCKIVYDQDEKVRYVQKDAEKNMTLFCIQKVGFLKKECGHSLSMGKDYVEREYNINAIR